MPNLTPGELYRLKKIILAITGGGSGGTPGGSNGQIQYNNNGSFGGLSTVPVSQGGTGSSSATSLTTSVDISTSTLLPKFRSALAKVMAGTANTVVYVIGDSTEIGFNNQASNNMLTAPSAKIAEMFNQAGINAHYNSRIGANVSTDGRLVKGSWSLGGFVIGGNNSYFASTTTTTPLSFSPTQQVDTVNLYWYSTGTSAQFSYNIDGGSSTTVTTGTTKGIFTTTFTVPLGLHTININWVAGSPGFIGFNCYDSSKKWISVVNGGAGATASAYWAAAGDGVINGLATTTYLQQSLTIIDLGINDWGTSIPVTTYSSNMQAIITQALTVGDVLLVGPIPTQPGSNGAPSNAIQQTYVDALYSLAASNNVPIVNHFGRYVSYAVSSGYYYTDGIHPLVSGIDDVARQTFQTLLPQGLGGNGGVPVYAGATFNGSVTVNGGFSIKRMIVSDAAYQILASDYLVSYTALTAARTATLPIATTVGTPANPACFVVKDESGSAGANNITVVGTIDGGTNKVISTAYGSVKVYSNGTSYFTVP